ncbi:MAG: winged helix-turn-helix domain-containing protein [Thermodesulfobacteriota bacterium]
MEKNLNQQTAYGSTSHNLKTPQHAFRDPILRILKKLGGQGNRLQVLGLLEKEMAPQLTDFDKADIRSGTIRWQKSAEWEVRAMRERQLLKPVSEAPRGVWALTAKGFEVAASI